MHTTTDTLYGVYAKKNTGGYLAWVAHPVGETPDEVEQRWDALARIMFACGVEPAQDDPNHTVVVDGVVTDWYRLVEIVEDVS